MDFTTTQQAQIRAFLGYPSLFRYKDTRLEGVIAGTGVVDGPTVALVLGYIRDLQKIDEKLQTVALETAGLEQAGKVKFYESRQVKTFWELGRVVITRISNAFGVPPYSDYYGQRGYPGDKYSSEGLGRPGGGNLIPLG